MHSLKLFVDAVMPQLRKLEIDALHYPRADTVDSP